MTPEDRGDSSAYSLNNDQDENPYYCHCGEFGEKLYRGGWLAGGKVHGEVILIPSSGSRALCGCCNPLWTQVWIQNYPTQSLISANEFVPTTTMTDDR